jgi:hypothetical protein
LLDRIDQNLDYDNISGLTEAHASLRETLGDDPTLPEIKDLFNPPMQTRVPRAATSLLVPKRKTTLQYKLTAKLQQKVYDEMVSKATGPSTYIIRVTSNPTSADFLFVRLMQRRNAMTRTFKTSVRLFLGCPVTKDTCNIGKCQGVPVHTNGAHCFHAQNRATARHDKVKMAICHVVRASHSRGLGQYSAHVETPMSTIGVLKRVDAPDASDARIDLYFQSTSGPHIFYTDVMVTHPAFDRKENHVDAQFALKKGVESKYKRYLANYHIAKDDVIPLVFDTYGGYAEVTYKFLKRLADTIGGEDAQACNKVFRNMRDRIAVALHTGHGELINSLINKGIVSSSRRVTAK